MNPRAARRELFSFDLVLVTSLAALASFGAAALGSGSLGGVARRALLLLRRAGREKHGGGSQGDGKETDHREKCRLETLNYEAKGQRPVSLLGSLHRGSWRRWWWLGSAGDDDDRGREGEECVFHSVMFVVFVVVHTSLFEGAWN